jgi:microcystin-dependent protein
MATRFQLGTISTQAAPAGVVQAFAGATPPTGWLLCNGAAVSRSVYAALFGAIASAHGSGDGSTTFNLPDYRGRIIRGRDGGIARDPDRASRTAAAAGGNTGDNVGSVQGEATKKNGLSIPSGSSVNGSTTATGSGAMNANASHGHHIKNSGSGDNNLMWHRAFDNQFSATGDGAYDYTTYDGALATNTDHTHNIPSLTVTATAAAQTIGPGDNETRPINAYVNYIIKV